MSVEDEILVQLVKQAEEKGIGISITLCVNGLIIVGNIISSKIYFEKLFPDFDKNQSFTTDNPSEREMVRTYIANLVTPKIRESTESQDNPKYIHLDKVVMYPSDPGSPYVTGVWRGKLSSIDGFSIGGGYWTAREVEDVSD
ncbi:MAG: hypothetical protein M3247_05625 [Thermoproteota archaeon]|nr:hypothetical protein [Thermoproteota archaeon]